MDSENITPAVSHSKLSKVSKPVVQRIAKLPPPPVEGWAVYLRRALAVRRLEKFKSEDLLYRTAGLLALYGSVEEGRGTDTYHQLIPLLFSLHRIKEWEKTVKSIPPTRFALDKVTSSLKAAATLEPVLERARFSGVYFVTITLQLPDPRAYVEVCRRENILTILQAFHPNTLERIKERYRGVVGALADPTYRAEVSSKLKTIT